MGGVINWTKMRAVLERAPEVARMVDHLVQQPEWVRWFLGHDPVTSQASPIASPVALRRVTVASLLAFWDTAKELTDDGVLRGARLEDLDGMAGDTPGFGRALALPDVGWARVHAEGIELPNFEKFNGKQRSKGAERTARWRARRKAATEETSPVEDAAGPSADPRDGARVTVTGDVTRDVTPNVTSVTGDAQKDDIDHRTEIVSKTSSPKKNLKNDDRFDGADTDLDDIFGERSQRRAPQRRPPRSQPELDLGDRELLIRDVLAFTRDDPARSLPGVQFYVGTTIDTLGIAAARDLVQQAISNTRSAEEMGQRNGSPVRNRGGYWNRVFRVLAISAGVPLERQRVA